MRDFIQNMTTGAPLHGERVSAVRDKFMDVSDEEVSDEDGCLSRSVAVKANNKIVKESTPMKRLVTTRT